MPAYLQKLALFVAAVFAIQRGYVKEFLTYDALAEGGSSGF